MHKNTENIQNFWIVGINYKKTDASVRGLFAVNTHQYDYLLSIAPDYGLKEFFIVSTCNRTEIYGICSHPQQLIDLISNVTQGDAATFTKLSYNKNACEAIVHLYNVAAGLDSQILGDFEILGQIKMAVKQSKTQGFIGAFTDRLVNSVLQSAKAIKTHTALSSGTVSVSFAATQYIKQNVTAIKDKKILLVGMGKIGRSTCRNLVHYLDTTNITLINRTEETAVAFAEELKLVFAPIAQLQEEIDQSDIIIVSTNSSQPVILKENVQKNGQKLFIDLSVPCNVEETIQYLPGITLINVDALSKIKDETLENRKEEVPKAINIINKHIIEFKEWCERRKYVPVLKEVKNKLQEMYVGSLLLQPAGQGQEETIQAVINHLATKMREHNTPGCNYIAAINDFIACHE